MSFQMIPLNQLVASEANVRRTDRKIDVDTLAASILAHGVLQNLSVQPRGENRFEVVAGGRRHTALKALAKNGDIARDFPVPCQLVDPEGAAETSLAENVQRVAMNAMDEADAFQALVDENMTSDDVARRFGVATRHVEQRLALARLSPKIKAAYRKGDLNLDAARAFCIEPDHAKQDAVLRALGRPVTHASQVRALLTQGSLKTSDRLVLFVGLQAYEQAGGAVTHDLFDGDTAFVADTDLIARLADERLAAIEADLTAQGWGWVDVSTGHAGLSHTSGQRLQPTRRPMSRTERRTFSDLEERITALDAKLDSEDEHADDVWQEREELDAKRQAIIDKTQEWDKELIAHAGVMVRIDHDGQLRFTYGLVAKSDQAKLKRVLATRAPEGATDDEQGSAGAAASPIVNARQFSKTIVRELTTARAAAIRCEVSKSPDIALSLIVHALLTSAQSSLSVSAKLRSDAPTFSDNAELENRRAQVLALAGEDALSYCLSLSRDDLLGILAVLAAETIDLVHEGASSQDQALQDFADRLSTALALDMRRFWSADAEFLARLSKSTLMDILENAPAVSTKRPKQREALLRTHAKLKRDALAKAVARTIAKTGWLPDLLVTPVAAGEFAITPEGASEVASIAAE